ncbi:MAG: sodium:solute symporter family protein [Acidobacteriota bacterium]
MSGLAGSLTSVVAVADGASLGGGLGIGLLLAYSALLIALGLWLGRRVGTSAGFFVAGRRLGPGLVGATVLAANIGAGSTVGAASLAYREGVSAWWWVGSGGLGTLLLALWLGPRLWAIAAEHDLRTVGDYLELRYSATVRGAVAALLWLGTLAILAGQLIAMAWVLDAVAGVGKVWGCLLGGVVMTLYFSAGGLASSVWVNLVQLVVLLAGFLLAAPVIWQGAGGADGLLAASDAPTWSAFGHSGAAGPALLFLLVPAFLVSPGLIQKAFGARDARSVRRGVGLSALALCAFAFLPTLFGMAARAAHPELGAAQADLALPTLLLADLPAWLGLLGLAAVFSAEISSADAVLFMLSTSLARDLWGRFVRPDASDAELLRVARRTAVGAGLLGVVLAIALPDVIGALTIFYSLLGVALFVPLLAGLHLPRVGATDALVALGAGVGALLVLRVTGAPWGLPAQAAALLVSGAACAASVAIRPATRRPGA